MNKSRSFSVADLILQFVKCEEVWFNVRSRFFLKLHKYHKQSFTDSLEML